MEHEKLTVEEQEALHITHVSNSDLYFRKNKDVEFSKHEDGDLEIEIDGEDREIVFLNKEQVAYLKKWL